MLHYSKRVLVNKWALALGHLPRVRYQILFCTLKKIYDSLRKESPIPSLEKNRQILATEVVLDQATELLE